jgi:hypothetical protein
MVSYSATVVHARRRRERACVCGAVPCRARSSSDWLDADGVWRNHVRVGWSVFSPTTRTERRRYAVTDFVPGATLEPLTWAPTKDKPTPPGWWKGQPLDRWEEWLKYSCADAVHGIELVDWLRSRKQKEMVYPWRSRTVPAGS